MANNNNKGARQQSAAAELLRVLQDRAGDGGRAGRRRGGADKGEVVSGSSFDKLSADANGGDAHEKALAQISYNFRRTEHPVFLFMQNIQSAPGSSVTLAIEQMRKMQHAVQRIDANHEGSSFVPPPPPPVSREESTNLAVSPEGAPSLRVHDYVVLPVPLCYLKKNPTHLYDFDTSNPKAQAYAQMVSFVTSSMSDLDVSIHQEHQKKGVPEWLFRPAGDKLVPRMRAYVEVVFRDDQVNSPAYRVDPISTDEERNFRTSDKSRWANQDMLAGYRIWWFLYDPELKPASMFKKRVFKSYFERKIANDPDLMHAYHMRVCIHDPEKIKRMRAANDRNMEDMIAQVQESLNVQNAEAGGAAAAPAAAPGAAPAPAPAPNANAAADDDDDDDEEEVPADDAGLPAAMQQAMGQAMQHAAPDVEDQQQQAAAAGGANEAGNNNNKKKQAQKKHAHAGPNMYGGAQNRQRARLASQVREPTVKSYYRNIYDYTQLSTGVFAVLNREARNEFANRFPDGLYCRHENDLDDWCMNMHTDSAPMYVQHSFNFANSVHVLAYCGGRKAGDDNIMPTINSMQSDPENYFVGGEMRLSSCFADAWFEYKPWDLDPEMNDHWMLPWRSSPLDNEITKLQSYQIQREQMTSRLLANGQDISHLTNHSTRLFQGQGMGSLDELIGVEQYQRLCQVLDPEAGKRLAVRERSADAHQQPADDIEVDAVLRIRQPAEFDTHWQKIRSEYSAPTSDERVVQATPYANRIESRGSAGEQHNTLARQDELLERSRQRQLDLQRRVAVHRLKRMRGTMEQAQLSNSRHYDADNLARELNRLSMLEKRLEGSETVMGSDETARQNYLRMMKDPQTRGTLVVPLRQMEDAAVNPQLVEELCREMAGRSVLQQQMDRLEDAYDNIQSLSHGNDPNSTMGRQSDRVRQSLSSHVTEGPIAKLEKRTVIRRARVMTLVAASPFKHTKEAINWLKAQEPWLRHQHQTKYECEAKRVEELDAHTGQAHPLCAYDPNTFKLKWTDKLEELYRREKMCELDALLRDETMTELNCMMNINNPELAGVHKGMLLAKEDRNTDKFFSPSPTGDLGMSRWSNNIVNEMAAYEMVMGTHQNHLLMLELMKAFRYNAMRHDLRLRSHLLVQSPPGREKSDIERKLEKCCPQEAILSSDYNSSLSVYANKAEDYFIMFGDEAPHHIVGDPEKMNQQQREQRDREKTSLTKNNVAWMRNVKSSKEGSEAREQERISKSYQINKLLFCNAIQKMKDTSMLDRFRLLVLASYKRSGVTLAQRVMSSNLVNEEDQHRNFRQKKVDEHILMGYAINMCNVGAIQKPCTDLFTYMMLAGETPLLEYLGWRDMGARATQRGMLDVSIFAFDKVQDWFFSSEASTVVKWNEDHSEVLAIDDLSMRSLQTMFTAPLVAEYDQCVFAMCKVFLELWNLSQFDVLNFAAHKQAGFSRHFYMEAYRKHGIDLPDVDQRARERGFQDADEDSSLIRQFHETERELDEYVATNFPTGPQMPKRASSGATQPHSQASVLRDPNYVAIECRNQDSRWVPFMEATNQAFDKLDQNTISALIQQLETVQIEIPVLADQVDPKCDTLKFLGIDTQWNNQRKCWVARGQKQTRTTPILRFISLDNDSSGNRGYMLIPIHFLMNPYPYLLQLFLTEHENKHTRSLKCILPVPLRGFPHLLHTHFVRPRTEHKFVLRNPRYVNANMQRATTTDMSAYGHVLPPILASQNNFTQLFQDRQQIEFDNDPELVAFGSHLLQTNYMPRNIAQEDRIWNNPLKTPQQRFIEMVQLHPARPGATEERIILARKTWPFYAQQRQSYSYPEYLLQQAKETDLEDLVTKQCQKRENSNTLDDEERGELFEYLETIHHAKELRRHASDGGGMGEAAETLLDMQQWILYASLSTRPQATRTPREQEELQALEKRYGQKDFVRMLMRHKIQLQEEVDSKARLRKIDQYSHGAIRAIPITLDPTVQEFTGRFIVMAGQSVAIPVPGANNSLQAGGSSKKRGQVDLSNKLTAVQQALHRGVDLRKVLRGSRVESSVGGSSVPPSDDNSVEAMQPTQQGSSPTEQCPPEPMEDAYALASPVTPRNPLPTITKARMPMQTV